MVDELGICYLLMSLRDFIALLAIQRQEGPSQQQKSRMYLALQSASCLSAAQGEQAGGPLFGGLLDCREQAWTCGSGPLLTMQQAVNSILWGHVLTQVLGAW